MICALCHQDHEPRESACRELDGTTTAGVIRRCEHHIIIRGNGKGQRAQGCSQCWAAMRSERTARHALAR